MRRIAAAALISFFLSTPARAEPSSGVVVRDSDVSLAFDFLREAMSAALHGREVAPPEALMRRAEAIADEAKRHGEIAGRAALDVMEREIRQSLRKPQRLPGSI